VRQQSRSFALRNQKQTPNIRGSEPLFLQSVVGLSNNNVWAVGEFFQTRFNRSRTLTEQWNGTSWVVVQSPNNGADHNELFGVDATSGGTLWAVGTVYNYPRQRTAPVSRRLRSRADDRIRTGPPVATIMSNMGRMIFSFNWRVVQMSRIVSHGTAQ
jgi:hypothetical protein